jgi:hypothetical protein
MALEVREQKKEKIEREGEREREKNRKHSVARLGLFGRGHEQT